MQDIIPLIYDYLPDIDKFNYMITSKDNFENPRLFFNEYHFLLDVEHLPYFDMFTKIRAEDTCPFKRYAIHEELQEFPEFITHLEILDHCNRRMIIPSTVKYLTVYFIEFHTFDIPNTVEYLNLRGRICPTEITLPPSIIDLRVKYPDVLGHFVIPPSVKYFTVDNEFDVSIITPSMTHLTVYQFDISFANLPPTITHIIVKRKKNKRHPESNNFLADIPPTVTHVEVPYCSRYIHNIPSTLVNLIVVIKPYHKKIRIPKRDNLIVTVKEE